MNRHDQSGHGHLDAEGGAKFTCKGAPPSPSTRFEGAAKKGTGTLPGTVAHIVQVVSTAQLQSTIVSLAAIPSRHTDAAHIGTARTMVHDMLTASGYTDVADVAWTLAGHSGHNVVCTKPGVAGSTDTIVVCAHYDSRMANLADSTSSAPGADDNASGVAAMIEIARLVADLPLNARVRFVAFSGEEQGLLGSTVYAQALHDAGEDIRLVINLDMIGFPPPSGSITVERDLGNATAGNDAASITFGAAMAQAAVDHTDLPVELGPIYSSDYMPFEAHGYVVIGAYEGEGNPHYHDVSDLPAAVDMTYLTKVTQMVLATLLNEALDVADEPAVPAPCGGQ
jgi:peptidase M28-like protein